jgi:hypothetical protein
MNSPLRFVLVACSDDGGIGFEFHSTFVKPYFEELREKEEAVCTGTAAVVLVTVVRAGTNARRSRSFCRESASQ